MKFPANDMTAARCPRRTLPGLHQPDVHGMPRPRKAARAQNGSMLLESFIAILIFSMGILAIVGMQASAIKNSTNSKYRSEASLLADQLIGQMWISDRTITVPATPALNLQNNFQGGGGTDSAAYIAWYSIVQATLPGSQTYPPRVDVNPVSGQVTISVRWKAPGEPSSDPAHGFSAIAEIR